MNDLNIALILRLVDRATGPAKAALQAVERAGNAAGRHGVAALGIADKMDAASQSRRMALATEAASLAAVGYGFYRAIQPAIKFEEAMAKVGAVSRADTSELALLTATARRLGEETPWAAREAAEGMQFLSMAGFEVNETVAAMPGLLNLASAGATDLGSTSDIASNILSGFRIDAAKMGEVGDILTNTFTSSNTNLAMLGQTMKYVAPVAESYGVSLASAAGMAGKLGDAGIQGEMAGTALRAMMSRLAAPSADAEKAIKGLNLQVSDAAGNLRPMPDILAEMDDAMEGMGTAARGEILSTVFGLEAASAATILLGEAGSGSLQTYIKSLNETGSASRVAAEINDNTQGAMKRLNSTIEALSISAGTALLPALTDLLEGLIPVVRAAAQWAEANPELIKQLALVAAALFGLKAASIVARLALEPLMFLVTNAIRVYGYLAIGAGLAGRGVGFLGRAFGILGRAVLRHPIIALVTLLIYAADAIYQNWDGFVQYFVDKVDRVKAAFEDGLLNGVLALLAEFNPFTLMYDAAEGFFIYLTGWTFADVTDALASAFDIDLFPAGVDMISSLIAGILSALNSMLPPIIRDFNSAWGNSVAEGSVFGDSATLSASLSQTAAQTALQNPDYPGSPNFIQRDLISGRRALGASVRAGHKYEVNEQGTEFFTPLTSGQIISARDAGKSSSRNAAPTMRFGDINVHAAPGMDERALAREVKRQLQQMMDSTGALHDGGLYA